MSEDISSVIAALGALADSIAALRAETASKADLANVRAEIITATKADLASMRAETPA